MASRLQRTLALIESKIDVPGLVTAFGRKALPFQGAPPRVVWVPAPSDTFDAATVSFNNPQPVRTRWAGVEAHCWGNDDEATEAIVDAVILALDEVLGSTVSLRINSGNWYTHEPKNAAWTNLGEVYLLSFAIGVSVVRQAWKVATISDIACDESAAVQGDGVLTCCED